MCVCVNPTCASALPHCVVLHLQPLAVDPLCVSDSDTTVQPWVLVSKDVTAEVWWHSII